MLGLYRTMWSCQY